MHLLILGGTSFVGRHIVETALAAGHRVTLFNRGTTDADLFAGRTTLVRGDRDVPGNVAQIADVGADAVVDVSGYTPDTVRASALAIRDSCARYAFVSSIDVFAYPNDAPDEDSPTKPLPDGAQTATQDLELYGAHKARCERDLVELLGPDRVFVARYGFAVGPHDATDRFTYWPARVARGGEVLAPCDHRMRVQLIDARDAAAFVVSALERELAGTYDVVGDPRALTIGDVLYAALDATGSDARFTWVSEPFLLAQDVGAWVELPLWCPDVPEARDFRNVSNAKARRTGLVLRPLAETVRDVLADLRARPASRTLRAGLTSENEARLLATWRRNPSGS